MDKKMNNMFEQIDEINDTIEQNMQDQKVSNSVMKKDYNDQIETLKKAIMGDIEKIKVEMDDAIEPKLVHIKQWIEHMNQVMSLTSLLD